MEITKLKHLTTCIDSSNSNQCIDGKHHIFVFSLKTDSASFEIFYKNEDTPFKVKQIAGVGRRLMDAELSRVNSVCCVMLEEVVNHNLSLVPEYVQIAKIIADELNHNGFGDFLQVAAKLHNSFTKVEAPHNRSNPGFVYTRQNNENDAYHHLSEMFLWDIELLDASEDEVEAVINNIIKRALYKKSVFNGRKYLIQESFNRK